MTEPVFTWEPGHEAFSTPEAYEWVCQHLSEPSKRIYRVDFFTDGPYMLVYQYREDAEGKMYRDGDDAAKREPYRVDLDKLPPEFPHRTGQS